MKNHRFLWLRNRTTDNRKCEKARNIKEKRTIEMFNTVLRKLVEHHSSQRDNLREYRIYIQKSPKTLFFGDFFMVCLAVHISNAHKNDYRRLGKYQLKIYRYRDILYENCYIKWRGLYECRI